MSEKREPPPSLSDEMPRATVELMVVDKAIRAFIRSAPAKQRRRFLRAFFEELSTEEADNVIPFRDRALQAIEAEKQRGAIAWARARLPAWMIGA